MTRLTIHASQRGVALVMAAMLTVSPIAAAQENLPDLGDPSQVAKVIAGVLSSRAPRARYLVGIDANLLALTDRFTPTMVKDRVTRLGLGI